MNRYVLVGTVYKTGYQVALQILETEDAMPTTLPDGVSDAWWYDITGYIARFEHDKRIKFVEPTEQEHRKMTTARMQERFDTAAQWIVFNPLQFKVDLGVATPAEVTTLALYKQYWIDVSEVRNQSGYPSTINWPVAPF